MTALSAKLQNLQYTTITLDPTRRSQPYTSWVRRVWRQEQEAPTFSIASHAADLAGRQIVHDYDAAGTKLGCENLLGICQERRTVHRTVAAPVEEPPHRRGCRTHAALGAKALFDLGGRDVRRCLDGVEDEGLVRVEL